MVLSQDVRRALMIIGREGPLARSEIAREMAVNPSRMTRLTEVLFRAQLIEETGVGVSTGGRRGTLLTLSAKPYVTCGVRVSINGNVDVVFMSLRGEVLCRNEFDCGEDTTPEQLVALLKREIDMFIAAGKTHPSHLLGLGLGISGIVSPDEGIVMKTRAFPQWRKVPLVETLHESLGIPVFLENEVAQWTLAELWFGNGRGSNHFLFVNVDIGMRLGMVIDGRLYRGASGNAGELGHNTYKEDGPLCYCGNTGCLERYVSTDALLHWGREALSKHSDSKLAILCNDDGHQLKLTHIFEAAASNDRLAMALMRRVITPLGQSLASLIHIFDTQKILLAGSLTYAGDLLLNLLRQQIHIHTLTYLAERTQLEFAQFRNHGSAIGGGALILEKLCQGKIHIGSASVKSD